MIATLLRRRARSRSIRSHGVLARHVLGPRGAVREVRDARRGDDRGRVQLLAALQRGDEAGLERRDALLADLEALLRLEPVRVVEEALERERVGDVVAEEALERVLVVRRRDASRGRSAGTCRRGMWSRQKPIGRPSDDRLQAGGARGGGRREPVRPGADDQQIHGANLLDAQQDGFALPAAAAQRRDAEAAAAAAQLVGEREHEPQAAAGQRMAERDRAAVDVDPLEVDLQRLGGGDGDARRRPR